MTIKLDLLYIFSITTTTLCGWYPPETGNQSLMKSRWRAELPVIPWSFENETLFPQFLWLFFEGMKKGSFVAQILCSCGCFEAQRAFIHSASAHIRILFFAWLSHLSNASDKLGLHNYAVVFILVKSCFLSRPHQVVRGSFHCISGTLQTHHLR